ncbi:MULTISPECIES: cobalamin B12-binding domain-containing protein [Streptomyces]|uniref:Cobalamin B12-binding domain-containing protein n=1 Tax=Streptomyces ardesiacus TaxID=285564 RepID=A0ABW8HEW8_9ACTN|nr:MULTISPECIES: cobalamin-dependent protein [Streptomyces]MCL7365475.1 cobalamin-dependent protein [Streptomyces ardesiacus]
MTGPHGLAPTGRGVLVSGLASDAHTWNLMYLQLLIEELGHPVTNLGPCVPDELLVGECLRRAPGLVVLSSVNGHGTQDGLRLIRALRRHGRLATTPVVIGGMLGITEEGREERVRQLLAAGFDAVFENGTDAVALFKDYVGALTGDRHAAS